MQIQWLHPDNQPDKIFFSGKKALNYSELEIRIAKISTFLQTNGVVAKQRLLLAVSDDENFITLLLALLKNNITAIILDAKMSTLEAQAHIRWANADGIITDETCYQTWQIHTYNFAFTMRVNSAASNNLLNKLLGKNKASSDTYPHCCNTLAPSQTKVVIDPDSIAYELFTSGTTAQAKAVQISHAALSAQLATFSHHFHYQMNSRILNVLPMHHADGLIQGPLLAYYNRAALFRPCTFSAQTLMHFLGTILRENISHVILVPLQINYIYRLGNGYEDAFQSPDFQCVVATAAFLDSHLWQAFEQRFQVAITNVYGLTETVTASLFSGPDQDTRRVGSIGKPIDCRAKIITADGNEVASGNVGELCIQGPHLMSGYFANPSSTAQVLRDGWLHTGDLVKQDSEGFYYHVGRVKNVVISAGFTIYPEEISEALQQHASVQEALALGLPASNGEETLVACIVSSDANLSSETLIEYLRQRLSSHKIPQRIFMVTDLPKGPSGKVLLSKLCESLQQQTNHTPMDNVYQQILQIAARSFQIPIDKLHGHASPAQTAGWTSLAHMEFINSLEKHFQVRLSPRDIMAIDNLNKASSILAQYVQTDAVA